MKPIEDYRTEYKRLQVILKGELGARGYVLGRQWDDNCRFGYGRTTLQKDLSMTYTEFTEIVRQIKPPEYIPCTRGRKNGTIAYEKCYPSNSTPACLACENPNEDNRSDGLTTAEEAEIRYRTNQQGGCYTTRESHYE